MFAQLSTQWISVHLAGLLLERRWVVLTSQSKPLPVLASEPIRCTWSRAPSQQWGRDKRWACRGRATQTVHQPEWVGDARSPDEPVTTLLLLETFKSKWHSFYKNDLFMNFIIIEVRTVKLYRTHYLSCSALTFHWRQDCLLNSESRSFLKMGRSGSGLTN